MKSQGTYTLLVLFFVGLGLLWWADFARIPTRAQREKMSSRILPGLIDTKPDDLRKLEILGGPEPLVFVRRENGHGWQMTSPIDVEADPSKVETLAYNLKELSRKPEAATIEGDVGRFGLAPPSRVIRLWGNDTSEPLASLDVGLETETLARRYVRSTGSEGVEVVDAKALALVKLPPISWRDRELFRIPSFETDSVSLKTKEGELKLRRGRDAWRIEAPVHLLASEPKIDGLIADLGSLRVTSDTQFVADNVKPESLERYGLKNPTLSIELHAGRSGLRRPPQLVHIGKPIDEQSGQVYVRKEGQDDVLAVDSRVLKDLKIDPNYYRSSKVADIRLPRVSKIVIENKDGAFEVARRGNDWSIVSPSVLPTDRRAVDEFLKALDKLETATLMKPNSIVDSGLDHPPVVLKVWQVADPREPKKTDKTSGSADPNGEIALNLKIGRRDAAKRVIYAQIDGDPTILALPDSANEFLPKSVLAFRDRQILNEEIDPIQRITLEANKRKFVLNSPPLKLDPFRNVPLGWWMVDPVDAPADAASVGSLLRVIAGLRAETLVAEKSENLDNYGLRIPTFSLTWSRLPGFSILDKPLPGPPPSVIPLENRSLLIGSPVPSKPESRFAKLSDRSLIFTVNAEILRILDLEMRNHQVLSFRPAKVRRIQLDWPTRRIVVEASGESDRPTWAFVGTEDAPDFDLKEINTLVKTASHLETPRFTQHLGAFPPSAGLNPPRFEVRFELDDGSNPRILKVGRSDMQGHFLASTETGNSGPIFLVPESVVKAWIKTPRGSDDLPENVFAP